MSPDLTEPRNNTQTDTAAALLTEANKSLGTDNTTATAKATIAQAHATLALAQETRAASYDTLTAAYIAYLATLSASTHADKQHAAVVDKLIRDRLNFTATERDTAP